MPLQLDLHASAGSCCALLLTGLPAGGTRHSSSYMRAALLNVREASGVRLVKCPGTGCYSRQPSPCAVPSPCQGCVNTNPRRDAYKVPQAAQQEHARAHTCSCFLPFVALATWSGPSMVVTTAMDRQGSSRLTRALPSAKAQVRCNSHVNDSRKMTPHAQHRSQG